MAHQKGGVVFAVGADSLKKKTTVSRSWMLLNSSGQGTVLDLDKQAIMKRVPVNARDLRILDPLLSYPSTILGREKAIVLNLEHIKAIITTDQVTISFSLRFVPHFEVFFSLSAICSELLVVDPNSWDKVLLRDPLEEDVVPIAGELQRRLPLDMGPGEEGEDNRLETSNKVENDNQTG